MSVLIKEVQNPPHFQLITTNAQLFEVCQQAQQKTVVALDTEFVRTRSFYPKLGLIQLYDGEQVSLIDPLEISDFSPFIQLLSNQKVIKVLHACGEDLEVFQHYFQQLPTPMLDTQIMAAFLQHGSSIGFSTLLKHYFALEIDKGASRTNWLTRPLSKIQLHYAVADVWYLLPLFQRMQQALAQTPWQSAVENDCEILLEKYKQIKDSQNAYFSVSGAWKLNSQELMRLKLLAKWRQEEAIKRDLALNFVVRAEHLIAVAQHNPKHISELLSMGLDPQEVRIHGKKILKILEKAKIVAKHDYPVPILRVSNDPRYRIVIKLLQTKLQEITPQGLPTEVLSSKRMLDQLIKWCWIKQQDPNDLPDLLCGWRRKYGLLLLEVLNF
ncbi:ribonuclease D [Canicola haemoglobinophilus]|uniref:Ribonuclease D n=1 Tax=Canicola haemoglobinophilus TaxID=733 RepID=A0AB38H7V5_9PAST|nr:ribonuclease D [Canicola haemoglobinophilus]STO53780.1 ribonuclease D [Canicola haemoglobinophilus]STO68313.1 ribonuclease D [Canicola haemoglobinophilus]